MAWGEAAPQPQGEPVQAELTADDGTTVAVEAHVKVEETEEQRKRRQNAEVQTWLDHKNALAKVKDEEAEARVIVTKSFFAAPNKGTNYAALGGGWRLKLVHGWNYALGDKHKRDDDGEKITIAAQIEALEDAIRELGEQGDSIVARCIRWKPELVPAEYLALKETTATTAEHAAFELITELLTITEASPQLSMVEPPQPKAK